MNTNKFSQKYYLTRYKRGIFSERGDKPFFYSYWIRYLKKRGLLSSSKNLLDYGCGEGFWLGRISPFIKVYGFDVSEYAIETTKRRIPNASVEPSMKKLSLRENFFHVITSFDVIEHVEDPENILSQFFHLLKNNGIVILSTPNPQSLGIKLRGNHWHGARDKTHINMKTIVEWKKIFRKANFEILKSGTDLFWDVPYLRFIPNFIQKIFFVGINNLVFSVVGFTSFKYGENLYFILRKKI